MTILVTGGAGFIGSNFVLEVISTSGETIVNLDKLTYAGNLENIQALDGNPRHHFVHGDIGDPGLLTNILNEHQPRAIINLAAESHVDRSILGPGDFIHTNVNGTFNLLDRSLAYWQGLPKSRSKDFRFLHVSTDEVYGSLRPDDAPFVETTPYAPNSPYAASKAASDHLVRAYHHTYGLPTLTTNCSNNYGPFQFPEKLIPLMIVNALAGRALPVYGDGLNVRDWLHVSDHCQAIRVVLEVGRVGEVYNVGGGSERTNLDMVNTICSTLDELAPRSTFSPRSELIRFVPDRPGHDKRYAIDARKIEFEIGWTPRETLETGIRKTVQWYLSNMRWVDRVTSGEYRNWIAENYGNRS